MSGDGQRGRKGRAKGKMMGWAMEQPLEGHLVASRHQYFADIPHPPAVGSMDLHLTLSPGETQMELPPMQGKRVNE